MGLSADYLRRVMLPKVMANKVGVEKEADQKGDTTTDTEKTNPIPMNAGKTEDTTVKDEKNDTGKTGDDVKNEDKTGSPQDIINEQIIDSYTYFSIYDSISSRLGNFYSETLAKMAEPQILNKRFFNQIYNSILNNTVQKALESAKSGEKLNFSQLAQDVKNHITEVLENCNYDWSQYQQNKIDENIEESHNLFNK